MPSTNATPKKYVALKDADFAASSDWFRLPKEKTMRVTGISGDTVLVEYRHSEDDTAQTLHTFTADGDQANSDALYEVRFRVSSYSAGTINATFVAVEE